MNIEVQLPATVSQYAAQVGRSRTAVYASIERGLLKVDEKAKVKTIVGGEIMLRKSDWMTLLRPSLDKLPRGVWGADEDGRIHLVDRRANKLVIERGNTRREAKEAAEKIERGAASFA